MASMAPGEFSFGPTGAQTVYSFKRYVDNRGEFSVRIEDRDGLIFSALETVRQKPDYGRKMEVCRGGRRVTPTTVSINSTDLNLAERMLREALEIVFNPEVKEEYVLLVACNIMFPVWKRWNESNGETSLTENKVDGFTTRDYIGNMKGSSYYREDRRKSYSLGIGARVYRKTTTTTATGTVIQYSDELPAEQQYARGTKLSECEFLGEWGKKLNLLEIDLLESHGVRKERLREVKEIPYTEDAARMFYQSIDTLYQIAKVLAAGMKDEDAITQSVASYTNLQSGMIAIAPPVVESSAEEILGALEKATKKRLTPLKPKKGE